MKIQYTVDVWCSPATAQYRREWDALHPGQFIVAVETEVSIETVGLWAEEAVEGAYDTQDAIERFLAAGYPAEVVWAPTTMP